MLLIFLIFVLIGAVSAANNETASISSDNNLDIDNVKVNNIDKLSESSSSSDSFSGENDKVMVDSSVKNQSNSRILKNTDNNVLSSGEDDILSANGEITTCTVTSYSVGKVTLNLGGWYYTNIDTYGVEAHATLSCNGYSSTTSLSATDATLSDKFMHFSGSATLDGAFYGGTKNTVSISVLGKWWAWSSSAGGWAWISGTVTKTASFTPSKATASIGSASSSNYNYGSSVKDKKFEHPLKNEKITELAKKKNCSNSDIIFAWHKQRGNNYCIVSKSENDERLKRALDIMKGNVEINLTEEEMNLLSKEDRNLRLNDAAKVFWEIPSFE